LTCPLAPILLALACTALLFCGSALASTFPITETFANESAGSEWHLGGSAKLTATEPGNGWLQLTKAEKTLKGYAFDNQGFSSTAGVLATFEYADFGGTGADGLTFFLYNAEVAAGEFRAGQAGGSLGYAPCDSSPGLLKAYMGIGFDEYGNFTNLGSICELDGLEVHPNYVSIRGSEEEKYKLLASAPTAPEKLLGDESEARHVTVSIVPRAGKEYVSAYIKFFPSGVYETVVAEKELSKPPTSLKFGFVGSTGGSTDFHEIRNVEVTKPTEVSTELSAAAGAKRGLPITWTAVVTNTGPNESSEETATATASKPLTGVSWTCTASGEAACTAPSGTGLPSFTTDKMPVGSKLTYAITGTPETSDSFAELTFDSEPIGEVGDLDPTNNKKSVKVDLTPRFPTPPTLTLSSAGSAKATPVAEPEGGNVSSTYRWQLCEPGTSNCTDIPGAIGTTYTTTSADRGDALRFVQTATNPAGSTEEASALYEPPTTKITASPAKASISTNAVFNFTSSSAEASFECRLDGGAWTACSSGKSYEKLAVGEHTFSVRSVYGNLSEAEPPSYKWLVEQAPTVTKNPADETVTEGQDASFEATASGTPAPSVQWERSTDGGKTWSTDGVDPGNHTTTLTVENTTLAQSGYEYRARFENAAGSTITSAATLTVHVPPHVSKDPVDDTVLEGEDASFTATATGTPAPEVQWERSTDGAKTWANDTTDPGNGTDTLTVTSATLAESGYEYRAKFTNTAGSQTTTAATLTVETPAKVTHSPHDLTAIEGEDASFEAAASGSPEPGVQWEVSTDGGAVWSADASDSGAHTDKLTVASTTVSQSGYEYRAKFTNAAGAETSAPATLTVEAPVSITEAPVDLTVDEGAPANFSAAAVGTPHPTVQWERSTDGGKTWSEDTTDPGHSTDTLTVTSATLAESGYEYRARFSNAVNSQTTAPATLTVHVPAVVTSDPADETVLEGEDASFTAAGAGTPAPSVQWERSTDAGKSWAADGSDGGNTTDTLTVAAATLAESGDEYRAKFTNVAGTQTTTAAKLTVHVGPNVSQNPTDETVVEGEDASFSAAATGTPAPTVQWEVSANAGASWSDAIAYEGDTTDTLTLPLTTLLESGYEFRATFTNLAGSRTSAPATLTVQTPPTVLSAPSSLTVTEGEGASFAASAGGSPAPSVQWEVSSDGGASWTPDTSDGGAESATLTIKSTLAADDGRLYRARFSNPAGSATTAPATLTVLTPPSVTADPAGESVLEGEQATFTAAASGSPAPSVQWEVSSDGGATWGPDTADPGNTTDTLTVDNPPLADSGRLYRARFHNAAGAATSTAARLTVSAPEQTAVSPAPGMLLKASLTTRATVKNNQRLAISCKLDSGGDLQSCSVSLYAHKGTHTLLVGRGEATSASRSQPRLVVKLRLNRTGRALLSERLGGLGVTMLVEGRPYEYHALSARLHTRLYPQRVLALPVIDPFNTARSRLTRRTRGLVDYIAAQIPHAHHVTCIGYTDADGATQYNLELGMHRANTVCRALRKLGVRASLSARSLGKRHPRASNATALGRELNRRVELEVSY
jgi:outer membrane protein OmpA-like peptidoglycan-associated protein